MPFGPFLQFCVTPRNSGGNLGAQSCSVWTPVGATPTLSADINDGGQLLNGTTTFAYEKFGSTSTCLSAFDAGVQVGAGYTGSFVLFAPTNASATLWLFENPNCCRGEPRCRSPPRPGAATPSAAMGNLGSSGLWNDSLSSFLVVWGETMTISNVNVGISASTATAQYGFSDSAGMPESGSTYQWFRAVDAQGTGALPVFGAFGPIGKTYPLSGADERHVPQGLRDPLDGIPDRRPGPARAGPRASATSCS